MPFIVAAETKKESLPPSLLPTPGSSRVASLVRRSSGDCKPPFARLSADRTMDAHSAAINKEMVHSEKLCKMRNFLGSIGPTWMPQVHNFLGKPYVFSYTEKGARKCVTRRRLVQFGDGNKKRK